MEVRRSWIFTLTAVVAAGGFWFYASRDRSDLRPATAEMEALVGAPLTEKDYQPSSLFRRWRDTAQTWWSYFTLPVPNQLVMRFEGDVWTYSFEADSTYQPPAKSPIKRSETAGPAWQAQGAGGGRYHVWVDPARGGTLVAQLLP